MIVLVVIYEFGTAYGRWWAGECDIDWPTPPSPSEPAVEVAGLALYVAHTRWDVDGTVHVECVGHSLRDDYDRVRDALIAAGFTGKERAGRKPPANA